MATVDIYVQTAGEAWSSMCQKAGEQVDLLGDTCTGVFGGWTGPFMGAPAFLILIVEPTDDRWKWHVGETLNVSKMTMAALFSEAGFDAVMQCNTEHPGGIAVGLVGVTGQLVFGKAQMIVERTDAVQIAQMGFVSTFAGQAGPVAISYATQWDGADDTKIFVDRGVNLYYQAQPWGISTPYNTSYAPKLFVPNSATNVVINQAPPLDLDVSVNQGQAILSVISKTTTMLP